MPKTYQKRPTLAQFEEVCERCNGVKTSIAKALGVSRRMVHYWCEDYPKFNEIIEEYRGRLLDKCLKSAEILALGIPKYKTDPKTGAQVLDGWKEKPDGQMLRFFMNTIGRREGLGESIDITSKGESIKPDPVVVEVIDRREQVNHEIVQEEE